MAASTPSTKFNSTENGKSSITIVVLSSTTKHIDEDKQDDATSKLQVGGETTESRAEQCPVVLVPEHIPFYVSRATKHREAVAKKAARQSKQMVKLEKAMKRRKKLANKWKPQDEGDSDNSDSDAYGPVDS
ncbi:unnamed protein product [Calypogeia fissa]